MIFPALDRAEFTVFQKALADSALGAILNEKEVPTLAVVALPPSYRGRIIPESIYPRRKHPDVRAARRAATIAALARVISERDVSDGLRRTLLTQARRLELLAGHTKHPRIASAGRDYLTETHVQLVEAMLATQQQRAAAISETDRAYYESKAAGLDRQID